MLSAEAKSRSARSTTMAGDVVAWKFAQQMHTVCILYIFQNYNTMIFTTNHNIIPYTVCVLVRIEVV